jgi:hypothetical protein
VVTVRKKAISKGTVLREKLQKPEELRKNKNSPKDSTKVPAKVNSLYATLHSKQRNSS